MREIAIRRPLTWLLAATLLVSLSGCLGTAVDAPTRSSDSYASLRVHLIAAPTLVRADRCNAGLADVTTYVPLWGLAVGILTFGIVVPEWTVYTCAAGR
jgi:hypothetical protein